MTTIHTLASGSSGNATLLSRDGTYLLIDAGISCRRISVALRTLRLGLDDLSAILITHTHTDHIAGLQTLLRQWSGPVYASGPASRVLRGRLPDIEGRLTAFTPGDAFSVGRCQVVSFPTSHDAPGPCGYRVDEAGLLTDSGYVTEAAAAVLDGAELLVLESNHDVDQLRSGPYPYYLKRRILGGEGHLSNDDAGIFAVSAAQRGVREIILAHLSAENNTPALALGTVSACLAAAELSPRLSVAPRNCLSRRYGGEELPCSV